MLWDVFCRVIDNFGDIGVCWRLCADLASRGHTARLWVDDASALGWMAPQGAPGVEVRAWDEAASCAESISPGDVVIESFGCNPPDAFVARMQRPQPPAWVNLEYLSAEAYVERSHGLASPVFSGPGAGLRKRFFYPGFTRATGGLLREPDLMARQAAFLATQRLPWLHALGIPAAPEDRLVSVFCYADAPLGEWLDTLQDDACNASHQGLTRVLLTPGHARRLGQAWEAEGRNVAHRGTPQSLVLHTLPSLSQRDFDLLLWACHLNIVRGEDSAVRALWAGRPHIWHIYPQDDGVHADKLDAFTARWMRDWPNDLQRAVMQHWHPFNGVGNRVGTGNSAPSHPPENGHSSSFPPLPCWRDEHGAWAQSSREARAALLAQSDLVTQLTQFVTSSG